MVQDYSNIKQKIYELIDFRLDKGTSPSELMENITSDDYTEIKARKTTNGIECTIIFFDESFFDKIKIKHQYIYSYDKDLYLLEIKHFTNKTECTIWNREDEEKAMLEKIIECFNINNMILQKSNFIKTLPTDLYDLLIKHNIYELLG